MTDWWNAGCCVWYNQMVQLLDFSSPANQHDEIKKLVILTVIHHHNKIRHTDPEFGKVSLMICNILIKMFQLEKIIL